ncbi:MAG TPA: hypothetical protein VJ820_02020 [Propionibacteriaceae bacterium]|nr:hypothetical protein [Propionibacteriaceae bacterium]
MHPRKGQYRHRALREAVADILTVVEDESVSVCQPPVGLMPPVILRIGELAGT